MEQYVAKLFVALLLINIFIFLFMLFRKIYINKRTEKDKVIREDLEEKILIYIATGEKDTLFNEMTKREKYILHEVVSEYISVLKNDKRDALVEVIGRDNVVSEVREKINSRYNLTRSLGAYQAGEYNITEVEDELVKMLYSEDVEQVFIVSDSLLKLYGGKHLKEIMDNCAERHLITKNSTMHLISTVEDDLEPILLEYMNSQDVFLKTIALEVCGIRQYRGCIQCIVDSLRDENKEIKISALKSALQFNEFPYEENIDDFSKLIDDESWEVRLFFAKNLRKVHNDHSVDLLKSLMGDRNWYVRNGAGNILLSMEDEGLNALLDVLDSEDRFAREKAEEIIFRGIIQDYLMENLEESNPMLSKRVNDKIEELKEKHAMENLENNSVLTG